MIHFDAVDFSECRSEEVISLFWRSVYFLFLTEELQVILCETSKVTPPSDGEISLKHIFADVPHIDVEFLGEPFVASVPKAAPSTRAQFEEASKHWPTAFHDDKE